MIIAIIVIAIDSNMEGLEEQSRCRLHLPTCTHHYNGMQHAIQHAMCTYICRPQIHFAHTHTHNDIHIQDVGLFNICTKIIYAVCTPKALFVEAIAVVALLDFFL